MSSRGQQWQKESKALGGTDPGLSPASAVFSSATLDKLLGLSEPVSSPVKLGCFEEEK